MTEHDLYATLERYLPAALKLQQDLHRHPDLSGAEAATRDRVLAALPTGDQAIEVADSGAVLRIGSAGPCIGLRAELDALPILEQSDLPWTSQRPGVMHACGHDVHLAALTAVVRALTDVGTPIPALVILQPREETYPSGAKDIADKGVLVDHGCTAIVGAHLQPSLPSGVVACVNGEVNASSDEFQIQVTGRAGHAAYPHLTNDPLLALAGIVVSLQSIVSRAVDPMAAALVGVSSFSAGQAANAVPSHARATGTLRALSAETRDVLHEHVDRIAKNTARAHGCIADVTITEGEPILVNDPALVETTSSRLRRRGLTVATTLRSLGADDFAFFAEQIPATMMFVGAEHSQHLHSPRFQATEVDLRMMAQALMAGYLGAVDLIASDPWSP